MDTVAELKIDGFPTAEIKKADLAWLTVALFIAGYDYYAIKSKRETLSSGFWRAAKNPKTRWPAILICTGLYKHLMFPNVLPKTDPLWWIAESWHRGVE